MRAWLILVVLGGGGGASAWADWPSPAEPRSSPLPFGQKLPWVKEEPEDLVGSPLADFRAKLRKLQEERDALRDDRKKTSRWLDEVDQRGEADLARLHYRLSGLLSHLSAGRVPPPRGPLGPSPRPAPVKTPRDLPVAKDPVPLKKEQASDASGQPFSPGLLATVPDPLTLANALFRAGNYRDALVAYRLVPLDGLKAGERMPVKYLVATCLRKEGKFEEASTYYLEVANSPSDDHLGACAQWQIQALRWHQDMAGQLKGIRDRRRALEDAP